VQIQRADEGVQKPHGVFGGDVILQEFREEQGLGTVQWAQLCIVLNWGLESPQNPQAGKPALHVARTFLSAGSGDFPVARHTRSSPVRWFMLVTDAPQE
jgi:hypothetical protein